MPKQTILIIEDEEDIQQLVSYHLIKENFYVLCADTGEDGLKKFFSEPVDLVILDLMLPGISGLDVCRHIKADPEGQQVPIIMLTAKAEEHDIVHGLEIGADDYITKPFSPKVLVARIKAHIRRKESLVTQAQRDRARMKLPQELEIDLDQHLVTLRGEPVELTVSEFNILRFLASHPARVFSRQQIIDEIRGNGYEVTARAVDVQIHGIRKKLKEAGGLIETVRGIGYRFKGD